LTPTDRESSKGRRWTQESQHHQRRTTYTQLAMLGMIKQDPLPQKKR